MENKFKYIQFALVPRAFQPRVKFITEIHEGHHPESMPLDKFIGFLLNNFIIEDKEKILFDLHSHKIVYLDNSTGKHISKNIFKNAFDTSDFKTLVKLNEKKEEEDFLSSSLNRVKSKINSTSLNFNPFGKK